MYDADGGCQMPDLKIDGPALPGTVTVTYTNRDNKTGNCGAHTDGETPGDGGKVGTTGSFSLVIPIDATYCDIIWQPASGGQRTKRLTVKDLVN